MTTGVTSPGTSSSTSSSMSTVRADTGVYIIHTHRRGGGGGRLRRREERKKDVVWGCMRERKYGENRIKNGYNALKRMYYFVS